MAGPLLIGGAPVVTLRAPVIGDRPAIVEASVLPGRGFMLLQAKLALPSGEILDLLAAPAAPEAARLLDGGPEDFAGDRSFSCGGAILAPFANRIRGRPLPDSREIAAQIDGTMVRLPRNWGGKAPGAETYAMHGLILAEPARFEQTAPHVVQGRLEAGDFGGRWPGRATLTFRWLLADGGLSLRLEATSVGPEALPIGLGWHPYFRLPSGRREQARLRIPAAARAEVNDYDEVLPTGRLLNVAATPYDFRAAGGSPLGDLYLDDCFTNLATEAGEAIVELYDPAAGLGLHVAAGAPPVRAVQVFAPPDQPFVVIEPQFNLADPFGSQWPPSLDTGMVRLPAGTSTTYEAWVKPITLPSA